MCPDSDSCTQLKGYFGFKYVVVSLSGFSPWIFNKESSSSVGPSPIDNVSSSTFNIGYILAIGLVFSLS